MRLGDTTTVCGIRGEILFASDIPNPSSILSINAETDAAKEMKELDLLVPNIELATGCSPAFLPGQPPSTLAQSLSTRLYGLLHSSGVVDGKGLRIWWTPTIDDKDGGMDVDNDDEGDDETKPQIKAFWTLYIDILFISLDGNPFDAAWAACMAALQNVSLPRAYWDTDNEIVLCEDDVGKAKPLVLRGCPVGCSFGVFTTKDGAEKITEGAGSQQRGEKENKMQWILADPDTFEEGLCDEVVAVVVDCSGEGSRCTQSPQGKGQSRGIKKSKTRILGISKSGGTGIGRNEMRELIAMAEKRWVEWEEVLGSTSTSRPGGNP